MTKEEEAKKAADAKLLQAAADKEAERIMNSDEGSNSDNAEVASPFASALNNLDVQREEAEKAKAERTMESAKLLESIARAYPVTTPDEHTVFGFGGFVFKLGNLRALFGLQAG